MNTQESFEIDTVHTSDGDLSITFLGHGSLLLSYQQKYIYIDVYGEVADYSHLPKADVVFITHDHFDHLDPSALNCIRTKKTILVYTETCAQKVSGGIVMHNGDQRLIAGLPVEAVPAYNLLHKRDNGQPYHPKGIGNGYVLTFGNIRLYAAGDTENIPEMSLLQDIHIAFLPMNLPYTMTPDMVAAAAKTIKPKILYPYHFGDTDTQKLVELMKDDPAIEVRLRRMP